jgi:hypothetical protein
MSNKVYVMVRGSNPGKALGIFKQEKRAEQTVSILRRAVHLSSLLSGEEDLLEIIEKNMDISPCWICTGEDISVTDLGEKEKYVVECLYCGGESPEQDTPEEAITSWNNYLQQDK